MAATGKPICLFNFLMSVTSTVTDFVIAEYATALIGIGPTAQRPAPYGSANADPKCSWIGRRSSTQTSVNQLERPAAPRCGRPCEASNKSANLPINATTFARSGLLGGIWLVVV